LERGLELARSPASGALRLEFGLQGDLQPELEPGGQMLTWRDEAGAIVLRYDQLQVYDAAGQSLAARLSLAGSTLTIEIEAAGAVYPLTVDPLFHNQMAILHASDAQAVDQFGFALALWGDVLAVGAPYEDGGVNDPHAESGAAYIFQLNPANWPMYLPVASRN
jgi:hypothetical protein